MTKFKLPFKLKFQNSINNQRGQILLVIVLLSAVLITVGLSIAQLTSQEAKISKLEEESKKALAAAEAGLDNALKGNFNTFTLGSGGSQTSVNVSTSSVAKDYFITPLLRKDQQYTFYLSDPPNLNNNWNHELTFYFNSDPAAGCGNNDGAALELTLIYSNTNSIKRWLLEPCSRFSGAQIITATAYGADFNNVGFAYTASLDLSSISQPRILIIRTLFAQTKIGFKGSQNLPAQGRTITSTANTESGVSNRIQLFQSYPQIPADFFVTTF